MATLRDHQRVASGDHCDAPIHVSSPEIESDSAEFERRKLEARELARGIQIRNSEAKIGNRGI